MPALCFGFRWCLIEGDEALGNRTNPGRNVGLGVCRLAQEVCTFDEVLLVNRFDDFVIHE
jgi:hypothetical protein